jgi:hypothetical protein
MTTRWLHLDDSLDAAFGVTPAVVHHGLADHPLLTREAMVDLAARLPSQLVEHHLGRELSLVMPELGWSAVDAPPVEVAENLGHNGTWMVFWHVEELPEYRALLHEILGEVTARVAGREGRLGPLEAFIFFSAPGCVTPAHVDPEHNFLLQVAGTKEFVAGTYPDSEARQRTAERYYYGAEHRNLDWLPEPALTVTLEPGTGVYSPYLCPHWVRNGDEVSISFSATFQTSARQKWGRVHRFNGRLRRLGLAPRPPGRVAALDETKRVAEALASHAERVGGRARAGHWRRGEEHQMATGPYGTRIG